jgi:molybdenum-dependent DNA-binding transcriptional regulator ModE
MDGTDRPARPRVIKLEHPGGGRRSVYVPVKRRAARFLEALAESGNVSLACDVAGLRKDRAYKLRKDDASFAAGWAAAKAAFEAREEAAAETLAEERLRREGLVVRTGRDGRVQVSKAHSRAWGRRHDAIFFAALEQSGNIASAAQAAGFSYQAAWRRARTCPAFAERLREVKAAAVERLEFALIEEGGKALRAGAELEQEAARVDPQLAMWLLKREDQKNAGTLKRGAAWPRPRTLEETQASILRKLSAIERHRAPERIAKGWTQTEEGHWIPPGYGPLA